MTCLPLDSKGPKMLRIKALFALCLAEVGETTESGILSPPPQVAQEPLVGQSLLIIGASQSHSLGLLWMSDQPDAQTSF